MGKTKTKGNMTNNPINYWFRKYLEEKKKNECMTYALRMEYEKGRADVIADTISWLENVWPQYCSNQNIIDAYKEGVVKD